jgi:hypothetical protein
MANNSRLSFAHKNDYLHINLRGDLDGSSACELVDAIHHSYRGKGSVYISIQKTCRILPFGMDIFSSRLNKKVVPKERVLFIDN